MKIKSFEFIEGSIEILLGLFFSASVVGLFSLFPKAIIGGMMFLVGLEMIKFARKLGPRKDLLPIVVTVGVSLLSDMAWGFVAGIGVYNLSWYIVKKTGRCSCTKAGGTQHSSLRPISSFRSGISFRRGSMDIPVNPACDSGRFLPPDKVESET